MTDTRDVWAIVLAAGSGDRFGGRKQFSELRGERLVDRAVATATHAGPVVVVLPAGSEWDGAPVEAVAVGGATRAESVRAALRCIPHDVAIVVVHDAAHPLATTALVDAVVAAVRAGADGAVPVIPASETVARLDADVVIETTPASRVALLQMPHTFRADVFARRARARGRRRGRRVAPLRARTYGRHGAR